MKEKKNDRRIQRFVGNIIQHSFYHTQFRPSDIGIIKSLLAAVTLAMIFATGCSRAVDPNNAAFATESDFAKLPDEFVVIEESLCAKVAYDKYTKVICVFTCVHGNPAGYTSCTMLVNKEGRPLTYVSSEDSQR